MPGPITQQLVRTPQSAAFALEISRFLTAVETTMGAKDPDARIYLALDPEIYLSISPQRRPKLYVGRDSKDAGGAISYGGEGRDPGELIAAYVARRLRDTGMASEISAQFPDGALLKTPFRGATCGYFEVVKQGDEAFEDLVRHEQSSVPCSV